MGVVQPGDVISHTEMCAHEGKNPQAGMHFRIAPTHSVLLMSTRRGAPYTDKVLEDWSGSPLRRPRCPPGAAVPDPKAVDQPLFTEKGTPTQNGRFYQAAESARNDETPPENVRVYEKVRSGIWVYNGLFRLVDVRQKPSEGRLVCKFRLEAANGDVEANQQDVEVEHTRG